MKSSLLLVVSVFLLTSCTWNMGQKNVEPPKTEYPRTQSGTPATAFCESNGGKVSIENAGTFDKVFCVLSTGEKVDAWKYLNDMSSGTGTQK